MATGKTFLAIYLENIRKIFQNSKSQYEAHLKSHVILYRMAKEKEVLFEILKKNMLRPGFFMQTGCSPDFQMNLFDDTRFSLYATFFVPLPDKRTNISYHAMHHHSDHILSTVSVMGPGYTSLIFKQGLSVNKRLGEVEIELEKYCAHTHLNVEFIDTETAHTVFYPSDISITYALWSNHKILSNIDKFKKSTLIQNNKLGLKKNSRFIWDK